MQYPSFVNQRSKCIDHIGEIKGHAQSLTLQVSTYHHLKQNFQHPLMNLYWTCTCHHFQLGFVTYSGQLKIFGGEKHKYKSMCAMP